MDLVPENKLIIIIIIIIIALSTATITLCTHVCIF